MPLIAVDGYNCCNKHTQHKNEDVEQSTFDHFQILETDLSGLSVQDQLDHKDSMVTRRFFNHILTLFGTKMRMIIFPIPNHPDMTMKLSIMLDKYQFWMCSNYVVRKSCTYNGVEMVKTLLKTFQVFINNHDIIKIENIRNPKFSENLAKEVLLLLQQYEIIEQSFPASKRQDERRKVSARFWNERRIDIQLAMKPISEPNMPPPIIVLEEKKPTVRTNALPIVKKIQRQRPNILQRPTLTKIAQSQKVEGKKLDNFVFFGNLVTWPNGSKPIDIRKYPIDLMKLSRDSNESLGKLFLFLHNICSCLKTMIRVEFLQLGSDAVTVAMILKDFEPIRSSVKVDKTPYDDHGKVRLPEVVQLANSLFTSFFNLLYAVVQLPVPVKCITSLKTDCVALMAYHTSCALKITALSKQEKSRQKAVAKFWKDWWNTMLSYKKNPKNEVANALVEAVKGIQREHQPPVPPVEPPMESGNVDVEDKPKTCQQQQVEEEVEAVVYAMREVVVASVKVQQQQQAQEVKPEAEAPPEPQEEKPQLGSHPQEEPEAPPGPQEARTPKKEPLDEAGAPQQSGDHYEPAPSHQLGPEHQPGDHHQPAPSQEDKPTPEEPLLPAYDDSPLFEAPPTTPDLPYPSPMLATFTSSPHPHNYLTTSTTPSPAKKPRHSYPDTLYYEMIYDANGDPEEEPFVLID